MRVLRPFVLLFLVCSSILAFAQDGQAAKDSIYDLDSAKFPPEFPGGQQAMYTWLEKNTHYPKKADKKNIQGKVYVEFVVEKDGHVDQVTLRHGCDKLLDDEALRVIGKMPPWKSGRREDGSLVPVRLIIPIEFKHIGQNPYKREG